METKKGIKLLVEACKGALRNDHSGAVIQKAITAADQGDIDTAVKLARRAADLDSIRLEPSLIQGVLLWEERGQQIRASYYFNQVIIQEPNNAIALWYLAINQLRAGQANEALNSLSNASQSEPLDSSIILTQAWLLQILGRGDEAKKLIAEKLMREPVQSMCTAMEILLTAQSSNLEEMNLYNLGPAVLCLLQLAKIFNNGQKEEKLLKIITDQKMAIRKDGYNNIDEKSSCSHIANPAVDSYRDRYGQFITNHYIRSFLRQVLIPECKRILTGNKKNSHNDSKQPKTAPLDMVLVPAGKYTVGCPDTNLKHPVRQIDIREFFIDRYPITNKQWREFQPNHTFPKGFENRPVTNVDFIQATMYARWKGRRLPTEVEWEAAARGPNGLRFPWGQTPDKTRANCADNKLKTTTAVTQYPKGASSCGAMDMLGNALEWVDECGPPVSGRFLNRVVKGGCYLHPAGSLASWLRSFYPPLSKNPTWGFRCAKNVSA